jgi:uncharacterized protein
MEAILNSVLSAPVLFFFLGMLATWFKSDLNIPSPLPKLFSLYLLMEIGLKGGYELHHELAMGGSKVEMFSALGACMIMALLVPIIAFLILKNKFETADAAAMAATFGSVSAVTFITTMSFLQESKIPFGGYMVAGMALMESPAIIVGVMLYNLFGKKDATPELEGIFVKKTKWKDILHDSFFNGSIVLLVGALIIGYIAGEKGHKDMMPWEGIFKGMLAFYLLDSGIEAAQRLKKLKNNVAFLLFFSLGFPLFNAFLGIGISHYILELSVGNGLLFTMLCASASYIAVPAAMRLAIPTSNPAYTVPVALGIVFPFNVLIGIPLYYFILEKLTGAM